MDPTATGADGRTYRLFFVRGHMRSGTNWLANLLNLHPRVWVGGEFHFELAYRGMHRFMNEGWSLGSREPIRSRASDAVAGLVRSSMVDACEGRVAGLPGAPEKARVDWIGDRTPAVIEEFLPGARYLHIARDGRDVLVSWTFHQLNTGGPFAEPYRTRMERHRAQFAEDPTHFLRHPEQLLTDEAWVRETARHWGTFMRDRARLDDAAHAGAFTGRVCDVLYETLHRDTDTERVRVYRFLDLDPAEAAPLRAEDHTRAGFAHDDPTSFFRRGQPGDWKRYRNGEWEAWFEAAAGEWLAPWR